MELMELVENEPTARPFQCDWQSCNKVCSPPAVPVRSVELSGSTGGSGRLAKQELTKTAELQPQVGPATALPHTHQRTAVPVHHVRMWQELHPEERAHSPHTDTHRREAAPVPAHGLRQAILRCKPSASPTCARQKYQWTDLV